MKYDCLFEVAVFDDRSMFFIAKLMTDQKFRMLLEINEYVQTLVSTKSKTRLLYCIKLKFISSAISSAEIADDCAAKFIKS